MAVSATWSLPIVFFNLSFVFICPVHLLFLDLITVIILGDGTYYEIHDCYCSTWGR